MKLISLRFLLVLSFTLIVNAIGMVSKAVSEDVTVNIYSWRDQESPLWNAISDNNYIPGVKINFRVVRYAAHESYKPHVMIEMLHDRADIFQWSPGASNLKRLIEKGFIKPNKANTSEINQAAMLAAKGPDNQLYGVPFALQLQSLLVNKKLVNKHGISKPPASMVEMNSAFSKFKSSGVTPIQIAGTANWLINQVISEVLVAGLVEEAFAQKLLEGEACFTDEAYTEVFRVVADWNSSGYINSNWLNEGYQGMNNSVALGNAAMSFDGGWQTGPASRYYLVDKQFEFDFWAVPGKSGKVYALGDGTYQVNDTSSRAEAAYKVLAFTTTKQFAELFAEHVSELPAYGGEINIRNPLLKRMSNIVASNSYGVSLFTSDAVNKSEPSYKALFVDAFKQVLKGEATPEQAGKIIQDGLNSWGYAGASFCR